jgi:hypothetical protein
MALYAAGLEGWLRRTKVPYASCPSEQTHSALIERAHERSTREERRWRKDIARDTRSSPRNTRIHRIAGWVLVPAGILAVVFLGSYWANVGSVVPWFAEWLEGSGAWALKSSRWAIAAAIVAAGVYVQRSYRDPTKRRALGGVWDIATFWPRSYHPFAPPTYSARAVPELRARIKELLDDGVTMLVVSSHSQGVPITMAAIAQLEADERNRIAFLSHGSPTGALYGAFFPDYYGPQRMKQFGDLLVDADVGAGKVRWRSIWRITDWTGGYAFPPPRLDLDANVDCTGTGRYERWMTGPPRAGEDERRAMSEVASMASEVEVLWCDPHRDAEISAGDPLPPSVGHHTYLTDDGYPEVCDTLRGLLSARPAVEGRESMSDGEKGKRTTVSVKAGKRLTDSGVVVEPGMRYRISARPTDRWIDWFIPSGPDGYTKWFLKPVEFLRRAPRAPWFALMATVGGGEPFLVGTGLEFNADAGGRLELFANDIAFMYWNNWGQIHVTIDLVGPAL